MRVLIVVGSLLLAMSMVSIHVRDVLVDSEEFGERAAEAFAAPEVREQITASIVTQMIEAEPELLTVQPLLETTVDGVLGSDVIVDVVDAALADLHRTVVTGGDDTVTVRLVELILVAKAQLTVLEPEVGALIPDELTDAIVAVDVDEAFVDLTQLADDLGRLAWLLPLAAMACFVAAVWWSPDPNRALAHTGGGAVGAAAVVVAAGWLARTVVVEGAGESGAVAGAVWDAFMGPLAVSALVVAGVGVVVAVVARFGPGATGVDLRGDALAWLVTRPPGTTSRLLRGLAMAGIGVTAILAWAEVTRFVVVLAGAALLAAGLLELVALLGPRVVAPEADGAVSRGRPGRRNRLLASGVIVVIAGVGLVAMARSEGPATPETAVDPGCNGSVLLCSRRLDEMTVAATHNSHAAAADGFTLGYQSVGIVPQLEDGIRGLLIDVYFGLRVDDGTVVTDRAPLTPEDREELVDELGESAVRSAEAVRQRFSDLDGTRDLYLCHAFCEIGAVPLVDELTRIREFLEEHPREVLIVIIQDEGPRPDDIAEAFEASGLVDLVHRQDLQDPFPTLGAMIEADQRVFVSAERRSGELDWYHDAFTFVQDTSFSYDSAEDFECGPNRGTPNSPLFLVNHWLQPVSPESATAVNEATVLADRIAGCRSERGRAPTMIAVDFYRRGDLLAVVDEMNRG